MRTLAAVLVCLVFVPAGVFVWARSGTAPAWTVTAARARLQALGYERVSVHPAPTADTAPPRVRGLAPSILGIVVGRRAGGGAAVVVMSSAQAAGKLLTALQPQRARLRRVGVSFAEVANVVIEAISFGPADRLPELLAGFER